MKLLQDTIESANRIINSKPVNFDPAFLASEEAAEIGEIAKNVIDEIPQEVRSKHYGSVVLSSVYDLFFHVDCFNINDFTEVDDHEQDIVTMLCAAGEAELAKKVSDRLVYNYAFAAVHEIIFS